MIPLVDIQKQYTVLHKEIDASLGRVLLSGDFILGHEVALFEEAFASYCATRYAVGVASGTDALFLTLKALGIGPGDEVIVPAFTFISTVLAIVYTGAKPVLVDVDPRTYTIDVSHIQTHITSRTKAILPVHLYGLPADMDSVVALAKNHDLLVVEDACQAHGARYKGEPVGGLGDAGCFSFYPSKNLGAYGDGGAVTTNSKRLSGRIRQLRNIGQKVKNRHQVVGYNSRLDSLQAAVLRVKLPYLNGWVQKRREIAKAYDTLLRPAPAIIPREPSGRMSSYHLYVVRVSDRDALGRYLRQHGVETGIHYPVPVHLQSAIRLLGYKKGDFPMSELCARQVLSLPMFPELTKGDVERIARAVVRYTQSSKSLLSD